jgi:hypothetical protein
MDRIQKRKRREKLIRLKQEKRRESLRLLERQKRLEKIKQDQIKKDALQLQEMVGKSGIEMTGQNSMVVQNTPSPQPTQSNGVNSNFNKEAWSIKPNVVKEPVKPSSGFNKDAWKIKD